MMAPETLDCVVDASVGIKLFINEPLSNEAHALFARLTTDPAARFYVPDLFYIECTNILWKVVKRLGLAAEDAHLFVEQLGQLAFTSVSTESLITDALDIALAHDLTVYDAAYVALAHQLALPLITADARLVRALVGAVYDVRWLGDLSDQVSGERIAGPACSTAGFLVNTTAQAGGRVERGHRSLRELRACQETTSRSWDSTVCFWARGRRV